jgi:hypothetical protein
MAGGAIDVYADNARRLPVIDPRGREMLMSLGAAVFNLRVAMLARGRMPVWELLPSGDPDLVARVYPGPAATTPEIVARLDAAIPVRRTNRRPFTDTAVPSEVLAELTDAAYVEGGALVLADREAREGVLALVRAAEEYRRNQPAYWTELGRWTIQGPGRADGVPPEAYGPWSAMEAVPVRDFGLIQPAHRRWVETFEAEPLIAVLYSSGDSRRDWLCAGQALERTLLTATARGVASTVMTQPLELPQYRERLVIRDTGQRPQAILRFGYGPPSPATPRRPLAEVVDGIIAGGRAAGGARGGRGGGM